MREGINLMLASACKKCDLTQDQLARAHAPKALNEYKALAHMSQAYDYREKQL